MSIYFTKASKDFNSKDSPLYCLGLDENDCENVVI